MTNRERGILYALVFILLFGVLNLYCQGVPYDNNAAGFILAGFGVLVTALVTWQVYTLIDMHQYRKDFEQLRSDVATEKQIQRRALREFAAGTKLLDAGRIIGSFKKERENYAVIGIGYCTLIDALKTLIGSNEEMINEILGLMRKCIFLAQLHNAWDKMFPEEVEELSKQEYHFIASGLMGLSNYVSQIDDLKKWRQAKKMDKDAYEKTLKEINNPK